MLNLPIYLRGKNYYLHTRVACKQIKRSLQTFDKKTAIIRAVRLLELILSNPVSPEDFDLSRVRTYEIDISKGIFRADGPEDHQMMMEALKAAQSIKNSNSLGNSALELRTSDVITTPKRKTGLNMPELLEKFFLLKSHLAPATILSYRKAVNEFSSFLKKQPIDNIGKLMSLSIRSI
jgi:hypothetical protein